MRPALWLLTPLLLLALLYALLPMLASYSIEHWLQARGIAQPRIELDYPQWNQLQIRSFSLTQQRSGQRIDLSTGPILIEYDPLDLIGRLHFNSLRITSLKLQVQTRASEHSAISALDLRPLLPAAWLALAPASRLQVGELELRLAAAGQPERSLQGNINLEDGHLHSRLQLRQDDSALGWIDLQLDSDNRFELRLQQGAHPLYQARGELRPGTDLLEIRLQHALELTEAWHWQLQLPTPLIPGEPAALQGRVDAQGVIRLPLDLDVHAWPQALSIEQTLSGPLQLALNREELQRVQLPLDARLQLRAGELHLSLPAGSRAELQGLTLPGFATTQASVELRSALDYRTRLAAFEAGVLQLPPIELLLKSPPLQHASGSLALDPISLDIDDLNPRQGSATGRVRMPSLRWQSPGQTLPDAALDTRFELKDGGLNQRFTLSLHDPALKLSGRANTRLSPLVSDIHWQASPLALHQAERLWNRYYPPAPPELGIDAGTLHHNGSANISTQGIALRLELHAEQLAGRWGAVELAGLDWRSSTLRRHGGRVLHQGQLRLDQLDAGFPVHQVALDYGYEQRLPQPAQLQLNSLSAQLLGGSLAVDSVTINPQSPTLDTQLRLQGLQLQRVLELQQQKGLSGEGLLSGILPLSFDASGFRVRDGRIASQGPGWIRFAPDARVAALGQAHQGMAMALQALKNFEYEVLSVDLQYDADGATLMNTRLQGRNPDWNNGRPVDFSINIEQNLLTLLKTLQFTDKLTESIEKRYR
ncbi:intermembrane phospholipid transport protein YdbH family protein [Marinobacterium rhizophilum]|uniref:YdbH domain-containing protein n=1 Tax=Marinobacterium rhizophilum TaxID=420402 RepID=A0ABY5HSF5_9GAMM|nr:YdbH domain-containing protein [Marinobacterium rhizophilum]UTW13881.1 YdbH domain-containing protein [Marinobacterium rhizophilum]